MKSVGKPDAANPHVRFDEREWETGAATSASNRAHSRLYHALIQPKVRGLPHSQQGVEPFLLLAQQAERAVQGDAFEPDAVPWPQLAKAVEIG